MIEDLENHPSIIVWVLFNEGWGQYETERLTQWLKKMDASRLVDNASGWTDMRVGDLVDVHSYPGPDSRPPESRLTVYWRAADTHHVLAVRTDPNEFRLRIEAFLNAALTPQARSATDEPHMKTLVQER